MVPGPDLLDSVNAVDLGGGLLVLWVVLLGTLLTSGVDPVAPPLWWGAVGLLLTLASLAVAFVLYRQTTAAGDRLGTVWESVPEWEYDDRHGEVNGTATREREEGLRESEYGEREP